MTPSSFSKSTSTSNHHILRIRKHSSKLPPEKSVVRSPLRHKNSAILPSKRSFLILTILVAISFSLYLHFLSLSLVTGRATKEQPILCFDSFPFEVRKILSSVHFPWQITEYFLSDWSLHGTVNEIHSSVLLNSDPLIEKASRIFDIRLAPMLTLGLYTQSLTANARFDSSYRAPFSWSSWIDLDSRLELKDYLGKTVAIDSCESFVSYFDIQSAIPCSDSSSHFNVQPTTTKMPVSARRLYAASYLQYSAPVPSSILFVGSNSSLDLPTVKCQESCLFDMAIDFINRESNYCEDASRCEYLLRKGISFQDEVEKLWYLLDFYEDADATQNSSKLTRIIKQRPITSTLTKNNFILNVANLKKMALRSLAVRESVDDLSHDLSSDFDYIFLKSLINFDSFNPPKYFYEANLISKNHNGAHYDWRFFNRAIYDDHERNAILHRITRAWLRFTKQAGLTSWLMHGTLLGYYFNGMNMPFDGDLDVVVTVDSLVTLAREFNQTLVVDTLSSVESLGVGAYFLDVNPTYLTREKGNGQNTIDARFVDIHTGLYIDITAIASTITRKFKVKSLDNFQKEFHKLLDPEYAEKIQITTLDGSKYQQQLMSTLQSRIENKEIFNCKNNHFYVLDEISPLKTVYFEGVEAQVPSGLIGILNREYDKALYKFRYKDYLYRQSLRLWVSFEDCAKNKQDEDCLTNKWVANEYKQTCNFTRDHEIVKRSRFTNTEIQTKKPQSQSQKHFTKLDPWLMDIANILSEQL